MKNSKIKALYKAQGIHVFFLIVFCAACFMIGVHFYDIGNQYFFSSNTSRHEVISEEVAVETLVDPVIVAASVSKDIIDRDLKPFINTDNPLDVSSTFKQKKKTILEGYDSGKGNAQALQLRLYLASLEGDQASYRKISQQWCQERPGECAEVKMPIVIRGQVLDEKSSPISGARLFFSGEENNSTFSDKQGYYTLSLHTLNPRRLRLLVQHPQFAGGSYTFVTLDPRLTLGIPDQTFEKNFTLTKPIQEIVLNTAQKNIVSGAAKIGEDGYVIENDFSKYFIPFDAIRTPDRKTYKGLVTVRVFEFDRSTANEFLQSDVFSDVYDFASEGLQTYSMPLIFFYDATGNRLEVFRDNPMIIWTTNRELSALIAENAQGKEAPGFNPAQYEESSSPENVAKYIKEDEQKAYEVSKASPDAYPITLDWIYQNYSRLPGFFVYDHATGLWESIGYSLVEPSTDIKHSIRSQFWTQI